MARSVLSRILGSRRPKLSGKRHIMINPRKLRKEGKSLKRGNPRRKQIAAKLRIAREVTKRTK